MTPAHPRTEEWAASRTPSEDSVVERSSASAGTNMRGFSQERDRFADFLHASINHNIALADRKSSILFTLVSAALIYVLEVRPPALSENSAGVLHVLWVFVVFALLLAAAGAFSAVFPRLRRRRHRLTFFGSIVAFADGESYRRAIGDVPPGGLTEAKIEHCHVLAEVAQAKFRMLRLSMIAAAIGLMLFVALSALGSWA